MAVAIVHGLSYFSYDWLAKDYSVPTMAQDLVNLLDHLGWKHALLVGHSMGGRSSTTRPRTRPRARGAHSDLYAPETAQKMTAANPRLDGVEVDGAGHDIAGDNPQGFLLAMNSFLAKIARNRVSGETDHGHPRN